MHQETSFSTKYTTSQDSDAMQAMVSHTTIDDAEDDTSLKPRQTKGMSKIEQKLASTQAALAQLKKERDLAMSERNEARTRLKELEKSLVYAQSESDTLRSDLALARRETTGDSEGMRQTSGRLSINYDTNVAEPSGLASQHESALYLPSPTSDLSDSAEKSQNENSPLIFDKSN
jgi:chromosome segregation ATPase